jgi:hypothetical protein
MKLHSDLMLPQPRPLWCAQQKSGTLAARHLLMCARHRSRKEWGWPGSFAAAGSSGKMMSPDEKAGPCTGADGSMNGGAAGPLGMGRASSARLAGALTPSPSNIAGIVRKIQRCCISRPLSGCKPVLLASRERQRPESVGRGLTPVANAPGSLAERVCAPLSCLKYSVTCRYGFHRAGEGGRPRQFRRLRGDSRHNSMCRSTFPVRIGYSAKSAK